MATEVQQRMAEHARVLLDTYAEDVARFDPNGDRLLQAGVAVARSLAYAMGVDLTDPDQAAAALFGTELYLAMLGVLGVRSDGEPPSPDELARSVALAMRVCAQRVTEAVPA